MTICYVADTDAQGWLRVKMSTGIIWPLPKFLKLEFKERKANRDHFKILEGRWRGTKASVSAKGSGQPLTSAASYIRRGQPMFRCVLPVKINITTEQLWYGRSGPLHAFTDPGNPLPTGTHDLEIPYEPHSLGSSYLSDSEYATTWFRIGHSGDRFLHPGRVSAGCATVGAVKDWTGIYEYLIKGREDAVSVARIVVEA